MSPRVERSERAEPVPRPEPLAAPVLDAHCHLDAMLHRAGRAGGADLDQWAFVEQVLRDARAANVTRVITVGDTVASSRWCVEAASRHPDVYAAVAVHPTEVDGLSDDDYAELADLAQHEKVVAVGETGLDYYWDRTTPAAQQEHFRRHLDLAIASGKPVMIHDRDAHDDVLAVLAEHGAPPAGVVFHSFSGDVAMAQRCVEAGHVLSFSGVVTFRNAPGLREALAVTPLTQLLVETDSPFLTPHPFRGRPNAPAQVARTARAVAEVKCISVAELSRAVLDTATRLFPGMPNTLPSATGE